MENTATKIINSAVQLGMEFSNLESSDLVKRNRELHEQLESYVLDRIARVAFVNGRRCKL